MKLLLIIDIDNTIAENEHRVHLLPDWNKFFHACDKDEIIEPMLAAVKPYIGHPSIETIFVTGRTGFKGVQQKTDKWLSDCGISNAVVHYRGIKDFSKSHIFKENVLNREKNESHNKVVIIDDDEKIIQHFNQLGHYAIAVKKDDNYQGTVNSIKDTINNILLFLENAEQTIVQNKSEVTNKNRI